MVSGLDCSVKTAFEIQCRTGNILSDLAKKHPQYSRIFRYMGVKVSSKMTGCAGYAYVDKNEIKISEAFFADDNNFDKELYEIVTHEAAHCIVYLRYTVVGKTVRDHGPEWKAIHRSLGGTGRHYHRLKLAAGFKKRSKVERAYTVPCLKCQQEIPVTATRYKRHKMGVGCWHKKCP